MIYMLSQPMKDKTNEEIEEARAKAIRFLESQGHTVLNTWFKDEWSKAADEQLINDKEIKCKPLAFMGKGICTMAKCDAVYFIPGWENARGCLVEHYLAKTYDLTVTYGTPQDDAPVKE